MLDNETIFKLGIVKSQEGDQLAYNQLLQGLSLFLKNYLRKRIFNASEIDEVIQEVLMAVHKSRHTYDSSKTFMSWFMSIVEFKIIDYIRITEKHKKSVIDEDLNQMISILNSQSDLKLDIEKALKKLTTKERNVLNLLKTEGRSTQEVATELKLTESNVKVIAHRAFNNLKKNLGVEYENI